jgi:hypothetical protein
LAHQIVFSFLFPMLIFNLKPSPDHAGPPTRAAPSPRHGTPAMELVAPPARAAPPLPRRTTHGAPAMSSTWRCSCALNSPKFSAKFVGNQPETSLFVESGRNLRHIWGGRRKFAGFQRVPRRWPIYSAVLVPCENCLQNWVYKVLRSEPSVPFKMFTVQTSFIGSEIDHFSTKT